MWSVPRSYKNDNWGNQVSSVREYLRKRGSCKGAAVQRRIAPRSRGMAIVRIRYRAIANEYTANWKGT
jgi:hypothetical protein